MGDYSYNVLQYGNNDFGMARFGVTLLLTFNRFFQRRHSVIPNAAVSTHREGTEGLRWSLPHRLRVANAIA